MFPYQRSRVSSFSGKTWYESARVLQRILYHLKVREHLAFKQLKVEYTKYVFFWALLLFHFLLLIMFLLHDFTFFPAFCFTPPYLRCFPNMLSWNWSMSQGDNSTSPMCWIDGVNHKFNIIQRISTWFKWWHQHSAFQPCWNGIFYAAARHSFVWIPLGALSSVFGIAHCVFLYFCIVQH